MDGKQYFRDCCEELGFSCDTLIKLGSGNPKDKERFFYQCSHLKRIPTQLFAVKYFSGEDIYIAWNLQEPYGKGKDGFSLLKREVQGLRSDQILACRKRINNSNHDEETVFAFKPEAVTRFLKTYVVPHTDFK